MNQKLLFDEHPLVVNPTLASLIGINEAIILQQEQVYEIQAHHQVSGLVETQSELGDRVINHLWEDEELRMLESDLPRLFESKIRLFKAWVDYSVLNGLSFYRHDYETGWAEVQLSEPRLALVFYDWAIVWELVSYYSPSLMSKQGYDSCRRMPKYDDDRKHWEVHLSLGCGTDTQGPQQSIWFCAGNEKPHC